MSVLRIYGPAAISHNIGAATSLTTGSPCFPPNVATYSAPRPASCKTPATRIFSISNFGTSSNKASEVLDDGFPVSSPTLIKGEYEELNLQEEHGRVGHVRIRQHVNPLSTSLSVPVQAPDWSQVFQDPTLPLMVDIGCGSGRFLLWLAKKSCGSQNFLGLEIRKKLVTRAEFWVKELALQNVYFMFANATVSFEHIMATYPGRLTLVSILCPDPYFKKRHHKRRVLQKSLVSSISKHLAPSGQVFVQSDVLEVAVHLREHFDALSDVFEPINCIDGDILCDPEGWLLQNPMGIRTEREIHAESEGAKIYRRIYQKKVTLPS